MHPAHSQLIAEQLHADRLRRAAAGHLVRQHRDALPPGPTIRTRVGDTLVAAGNRLATLGDRIVATASPPSTATSHSRVDGSRGRACAGC
jgi:hypothetical protein